MKDEDYAEPLPLELDDDADRSPRFEERSSIVSCPPQTVMSTVISTTLNGGEEFRILAAKVRAQGAFRSTGCLGILSAAPGEGKTTVAVGLCVAMARDAGRRILLIEADLRKPAIEKYLGLAGESGLSEWLDGSTKTVGVRRVMPQGFYLLPAGHSTSCRPELLGSERMARLIQVARRSFDTVVLDCPPLIPVADSLLLQDRMDSVLWVVRAGKNPVPEIARALGQLEPQKVLGIVLNDHQEMRRSYYRYAQ